MVSRGKQGEICDMSDRLPDWQLPAGVDRALWEYLTTEAIAEDYDEYFAQTRLLTLDRDFLRESFHEPGRLIDLGCGTGRLSLDFAARGFDVVGIDLSTPMLDVTRRKMNSLGLSIELRQANICDLSDLSAESFDYAISMFSTWGMVVGTESRRRALREVHRLLRPGGKLGLHVHNRWFNFFDPQGRVWLFQDLGRQILGSSQAGDKVQIRYRGIPNLRLHLFSASELRRELRRAGFRIKRWLPLAPDRTGGITFPKFFSSLRCNGWLVVAERADPSSASPAIP
jgi:ubiquinone/menaquinone biosynthesis C-methylase UbiE